MSEGKEKIELINIQSEKLPFEDLIIKRIKNIILPSVICAFIIAGFFNVRNYINFTPLYRAVATVIIDGKENDKESYRKYQDAVYAYSDLVKTSLVLENMTSKGLDGITTKDLKSILVVQPKPLSQMVDISVTLPEGDKAIKIVNTAAQSLKEVSNRVMGEDLVTVVDSPSEAILANSKFKLITFAKDFLKYLALVFTIALILVITITTFNKKRK